MTGASLYYEKVFILYAGGRGIACAGVLCAHCVKRFIVVPGRTERNRNSDCGSAINAAYSDDRRSNG
jgi:hypothetical protein